MAAAEQTPPRPAGGPAALPGRAFRARAAPLGPDRPRPGGRGRLLRLGLLPRLGRRRGGGGAGRGDPLPLRRRGLPGADRPLRRGCPARAQADAPERAAVPDGGVCLGAALTLGLAAGSLGLGPKARSARRLPRPRLPAQPRRPRRRVALLGPPQAVLRGRRPHPVRVPLRGRRPACSPARRSPGSPRSTRESVTATTRRVRRSTSEFAAVFSGEQPAPRRELPEDEAAGGASQVYAPPTCAMRIPEDEADEEPEPELGLIEPEEEPVHEPGAGGRGSACRAHPAGQPPLRRDGGGRHRLPAARSRASSSARTAPRSSTRRGSSGWGPR